MAPNLGWIDVPLGQPPGAGARHDRADPVLNDADVGAPRRAPPRGGRSAWTTSCTSRARSASAAASIVGGRPLTGAAGYAGEVGHITVNPDGLAVPLRLGGLLGDRGRRGRVARPRVGRPTPGARASTRSCGGRGRRRRGGRGPRPRRPLAGHRPAGLVNVLNPRLVDPRRAARPRLHPFVAAAIDEGSTRCALPAPRALVRVVPAPLGVDAPLRRRGRARVRAAPGGPGGVVRAPRSSPPPGERRDDPARPPPSRRTSPLAATCMKGCLKGCSLRAGHCTNDRRPSVDRGREE